MKPLRLLLTLALFLPLLFEPLPPSDLAARAISQSQIDLAWTDNACDENGFIIERSPDGLTGWAEAGRVGVDVRAFSDNGLACAQTAYYRVRAYNTFGGSAYSNIAAAGTPDCPPAAPVGLRAWGASQDRIHLDWSAVLGVQGYLVERSLQEASGFAEIGGGPDAAFFDASVEPGVSYYYRVRAYAASGYSDYSNTARASALVPPVTPGLFRVYLPVTAR